MLCKPVPLLPDWLRRIGHAPVNAILLPHIQIQPQRAQQIDQRGGQLDRLNGCPHADQQRTDYGICNDRRRLQNRHDIRPLIRHQEQLIGDSEIILRKRADTHRKNQKCSEAETKIPHDHRIHCHQNQRISRHNRRNPAEKLVGGSDNRAHGMPVLLCERLIQIGLYHSADAELQKGNDGQKLRDRRHQSVDLRAICAQNDARQNKAAKNRDNLVSERRNRIPK